MDLLVSAASVDNLSLSSLARNYRTIQEFSRRLIKPRIPLIS
jgi:hypothetical protein